VFADGPLNTPLSCRGRRRGRDAHAPLQTLEICPLKPGQFVAGKRGAKLQTLMIPRQDIHTTAFTIEQIFPAR